MSPATVQEERSAADAKADVKRRAACVQGRLHLLRKATGHCTEQLLKRTSRAPGGSRVLKRWARENEGFWGFVVRHCSIGQQLLEALQARKQARDEQEAARSGGSRPGTPPAYARPQPSTVNRRRSGGHGAPSPQLNLDVSVVRGTRMRTRTAPAQPPLSPRVRDRLYKR
ncbi:uncharacterized protein LOC124616687 [Schistocerca americana]|uniref:uncharacterized protein LOC124616687 n=1 Tax=Schistocerca americana TaxID=7009 RepID=UPI001F4F9875|nr:uncharacterized protein LOC124616687 [Schistocerca americana]